jgi:very-short-patch-repair endonuclease
LRATRALLALRVKLPTWKTERKATCNRWLYLGRICAAGLWLPWRVNDYARHLRNNATEAERRLWQKLRRRQLNGFKFRRQRAIGRYVCDFVCLEAAVVVELDGSQHVGQAPYDEQRDAFLRSNGFRVLRFWNGDVYSEPDAVVQTIVEALTRSYLDGRFD